MRQPNGTHLSYTIPQMPFMQGSFDGYQYVDYLRGRWRFAAVACSVAFALALGISLVRTKRYSATARIMIEPRPALM